MEKVEENARNCEEQIQKEIQEMTDRLLQRQVELMGSVEEIRHQKRKELNLQKDDLEFTLQGMAGSIEIIQNILDHGTPVEIATDMKQMNSRLDTLDRFDYSLQPCQDSILQFDLINKESLINLINEFGSIPSNSISSDHSSIEIAHAAESSAVNVGLRANPFVGKPFSFQVIARDSKGNKIKDGIPFPFSTEIIAPDQSVIKVSSFSLSFYSFLFLFLFSFFLHPPR